MDTQKIHKFLIHNDFNLVEQETIEDNDITKYRLKIKENDIDTNEKYFLFYDAIELLQISDESKKTYLDVVVSNLGLFVLITYELLQFIFGKYVDAEFSFRTDIKDIRGLKTLYKSLTGKELKTATKK